MKNMTHAAFMIAGIISGSANAASPLVVTFTCTAPTYAASGIAPSSYVAYASGSAGAVAPNLDSTVTCAQAIADQLGRGMFLKSSTGIGVSRNDASGTVETYVEYVFTNSKN